jgi:hypothetical protein
VSRRRCCRPTHGDDLGATRAPRRQQNVSAAVISGADAGRIVTTGLRPDAANDRLRAGRHRRVPRWTTRTGLGRLHAALRAHPSTSPAAAGGTRGYRKAENRPRGSRSPALARASATTGWSAVQLSDGWRAAGRRQDGRALVGPNARPGLHGPAGCRSGVEGWAPASSNGGPAASARSLRTRESTAAAAAPRGGRGWRSPARLASLPTYAAAATAFAGGHLPRPRPSPLMLAAAAHHGSPRTWTDDADPGRRASLIGTCPLFAGRSAGLGRSRPRRSGGFPAERVIARQGRSDGLLRRGRGVRVIRDGDVVAHLGR